MGGVLALDGSHGEGGGQVLRTALSLSIVTGRPVHLRNIRAGRRNPGLQPQHLSAVRAAAAISDAAVSGDHIGSIELTFAPRSPAMPGQYQFDVAEIAEHGSAGCVNLILQTLLVPLAGAPGPTVLTLRGGTHVESAPSFDDIENAYLPALRRMGLSADAELAQWGWYPVGGGEVVCRIAPTPRSDRRPWLRPILATEQGALLRIRGRAVAANLPMHIAQRIRDRASAGLGQLSVPIDIEPQCVSAPCAGAGIFSRAEYDGLAASFSAYGKRGKPSEAVADEAVGALLAHQSAGAAVELHLADQLLLPLAVASGASVLVVARSTPHLVTNAWVIEQFGIAEISIDEGAPCRVGVKPRQWR